MLISFYKVACQKRARLTLPVSISPCRCISQITVRVNFAFVCGNYLFQEHCKSLIYFHATKRYRYMRCIVHNLGGESFFYVPEAQFMVV
jgi:hypothetical protein